MKYLAYHAVMKLVWIPAAALLLASCAPSNPPFTPLIHATRAGDLASMAALLDRGANPDEPAGVNRWPPIHHAVHKHQRAALALLLERGADPNAAPPNGYTALMMAGGYGDLESARVLLSHGADARRRTRNAQSALHFAVGGALDIDRFTAGDCQTETVKLLAAAAPELRLGGALTDRLPVWLARAGGCGEVVRVAQR